MNRSAGGPSGPGGPGGGKPPQKKSSQILTGILIGMVIGVAMAAVLAWFIVKSPSPFVQKDRSKPPVEDAKPPVAITKPPIEAPKPITKAPEFPPVAAASGVDENKPRFEFYKVLTDKQDTTTVKPVEKQQPAKQPPVVSKTENKADGKTDAKVDNKTVNKGDTKVDAKVDTKVEAKTSGNYFLQAGSFSNAEDADKLKAKLAMMGVEASVQTATIPDRGVWHRVRAGPYTNADEMNNARNLLKENNIDATPVRSQ